MYTREEFEIVLTALELYGKLLETVAQDYDKSAKVKKLIGILTNKD